MGEWDDLNALLPEVIAIAQAAGRAILPFHRSQTGLDVITKRDQSPVTQADYAANTVITERLSTLCSYPILSEENTIPPFEERVRWERYWLVDPLDGTRSFIQGGDDFTVNIALIERGRPILGVIDVPATSDTYYATRASSAMWVHSHAEPVPCQTRAWQGAQDIEVATSRRREQQVIEELTTMGLRCRIQRMGSSVKFCLIARGLIDVYPRFAPTSEWDTAAGQCIVEQAGGCVVDPFGQALRYNRQDSVLNPHFLAVGDIRLFERYLAQ